MTATQQLTALITFSPIQTRQGLFYTKGLEGGGRLRSQAGADLACEVKRCSKHVGVSINATTLQARHLNCGEITVSGG